MEIAELRRQAQESHAAGKWEESVWLYQQIAGKGIADFWDLHNLASAPLFAGDLNAAERLIDDLPTIGGMRRGASC